MRRYLRRWLVVELAVFAVFAMAYWLSAHAAPLPPGVPAPAVQSAAPIAGSLCGRGLGGRCTKGRAACTQGTPAQCAQWKKWSAACSACARTFAKCRELVGRGPAHTCDKCLAAHDACEARIRRSH